MPRDDHPERRGRFLVVVGGARGRGRAGKGHLTDGRDSPEINQQACIS
ncbi:hypothetical protein CZ771_14395 [Actinomycetales bacterium JB111]|nr:hypothetical protein CZ771_14395 [Actinomycetales bacterium JB111]